MCLGLPTETPFDLGSPKGTGDRTARRPIEKFHGMHHRNLRSRADLDHATDVPGRHNVRPEPLDVGDLHVLEFRRDPRLQKIVCSGGSAAQVSITRLDDLKTRIKEQLLGLQPDLLTVLQ